MESLRESMGASFVLILAAAVVLNLLVFGLMDQILYLLQVPEEIEPLMREYLWWIFWGILATFLYNYFASLLRAVGNSVVPLLFLAVCAVLNVVLDLSLIHIFRIGSAGGIAEGVQLRDVVFAMSSCTDSNYGAQFRLPGTFAPTADFSLLEKAVQAARKLEVPHHVGCLLYTSRCV